MKNKFIKKKIKGIKVDVRTKDCMYITIGKWVIYIDNSTNEKIIAHAGGHVSYAQKIWLIGLILSLYTW